MGLEFLRVFCADCIRDLASFAKGVEVFYRADSVWHTLTGSKLTDENISSCLQKAITDPIAAHLAKDIKAWYYLAELDATVCITHYSSPRQNTRKTTRKKIETSLVNSRNAYKVTHNQLTDLLARDAIRSECKRLLTTKNLPSAALPSDTGSSDGLSIPIVAAIAFDLDKFKQVNDTFGHLYGDQVLKAFALRLSKVANSIRDKHSENGEIILGHPSGEEFICLLSGTYAIPELAEIANQFRKEIADSPLPSDADWATLSKHNDLTKLKLPTAIEREITASLGIAFTSPKKEIDISDSDVLALLDKSDMALYRSKVGGRNRVTLFNDILQNCGRILEHDLHTGVVAVDIGSKVGVSIGQEFRVFPATFSGSTQFTIDDGRSRRTLGIYPRVEVSRIVVFNVQYDMSFARVSVKDAEIKELAVASHLEAVPLGTISHLLPSTPAWMGVGPVTGQVIASGAELQNAVDTIREFDGKCASIVLRFNGDGDFIQKYGTAAFNNALAEVFSTLSSALTSNYHLGIIDQTSICGVVVADLFDLDTLALAQTKANETSGELSLICGYYHPEETDNEFSDSLQNGAVIDFARYAASQYAHNKSQKPERFSATTANRLMSKLRELRLFDQAIK